MARRRVLWLLLVVSTLWLGGCSAFVTDPQLHITNESPTTADLSITIVREGPPDQREEVYNGTVLIAPHSQRNLTVFSAPDGYDITARTGTQTLRFGTYPTCADATTTITIQPSGRLVGFATSCSDHPHTPVVASTPTP